MFLLRSQPFVLVVLFWRIIHIFSLIAFEFFVFLVFYNFTSHVLSICCLMFIVVWLPWRLRQSCVCLQRGRKNPGLGRSPGEGQGQIAGDSGISLRGLMGGWEGEGRAKRWVGEWCTGGSGAGLEARMEE